MKKFILVGAFSCLTNLSLFAQGLQSRTEINSMLNSWLVPVLGLGLIIGFAGLVWHNIDGIRGKNGASKQDAWTAVGEGMIFVILGIAAIGYVANKVAAMNFSI